MISSKLKLSKALWVWNTEQMQFRALSISSPKSHRVTSGKSPLIFKKKPLGTNTISAIKGDTSNRLVSDITSLINGMQMHLFTAKILKDISEKEKVKITF